VVCTSEKNFPVLIENQVADNVRPVSPTARQKPETPDFNAGRDCATAHSGFLAEGAPLKRPWQSPCSGRVTIEDVTSERPAAKDGVEFVDVASNASTQRGEMSVDPQLHLLDFQLRHILKTSPSAARDDASSAAGDIPAVKARNPVEGSPSRSFVYGRGAPPATDQCVGKPPHSGSMRCDPADRPIRGGRSDGNESGSGEAGRGRCSRSVERGRRPSCARKDTNEDGADQPADNMKKSSVDAAGSGGITFGGVEELSHGNVPAEDLPTTNIYLDDHATKAAPYTIASQFYSLGSEADDDDASEGAPPDKKLDEEGVSPSAHQTVADKPRRPVTLTRSSASTAERGCEQADGVCRRGSSVAAQFAGSTVVTRTLSANCALAPEVFPRPRFSVRSPSSPARLANGDVVADGKPQEITVEPAVVGNASPPKDGSMAAAPLAAQEPDGSESNSTSDVDVGVMAALSANTPGEQLAVLRAETRGAADGESARIPCETADGAGNGEVSSLSAKMAGGTPSGHTDVLAAPAADFPDIVKTTRVVPMAVAKKIADCLDVSLGSDKEVKEIMRNCVPAMDRVDRALTSAPVSRFVVVSKALVDSSNKVPNSAAESTAVSVGSVSVPVVSENVPANRSGARRHSNTAAAGQPPCLSAVLQSRCDDTSDTASLLLVKTETFSSPECLPRPPSGRVSKKASIANRARCVLCCYCV